MSDKPTALYHHEHANVTFVWQRGAPAMLVYRGDHINGPVEGPPVAHVPVPPNGWIDQVEVRNRAQAWLADHRSQR